MTTEISVSTLGDAVKERVRKAIFDSIPDEAIASLIEKELSRMTYDGHRDYDRPRGKNDVRYDSELLKLIGEEIREQLGEKAKIAVAKYIEETYQAKSKEMVDAAIKELAPIFIAGMAERFASAAVSQLRNDLGNKGFNVY